MSSISTGIEKVNSLSQPFCCSLFEFSDRRVTTALYYLKLVSRIGSRYWSAWRACINLRATVAPWLIAIYSVRLVIEHGLYKGIKDIYMCRDFEMFKVKVPNYYFFLGTMVFRYVGMDVTSSSYRQYQRPFEWTAH